MITQQVMATLSPVEAINYNINKFCHHFDDRRGRIAFLKKLVDDGVIMPLQYPHNALSNPKLAKMLSTAHYSMQFPFGEDAQAQGGEEVLTDDLEVVSGPVNLTNPRWEHKKVEAEDEDKKEDGKASFGDTIILMADVSGIPESAPVSFDIYDTSEDPPMVIDSAKGKNEGGVAKGEWVVADKSGKGEEAMLKFEAVARSKVSERCEIPFSTVFQIHLQIDVDDPKAKDDILILLDENGSEVMKLYVGEMKEVSENIVSLTFEDLPMDTKYSLVRDYGTDEDGGHDPLFVKLSLNEIKELFKD
jgi:hypothetical protein